MTAYRMDDGTVVKTENATQNWGQEGGITNQSGTYVERLYRSRKGRYWLERIGLEGRKDYAEWVGDHTAALWLLEHEFELPEDLKPLESEVSE